MVDFVSRDRDISAKPKPGLCKLLIEKENAIVKIGERGRKEKRNWYFTVYHLVKRSLIKVRKGKGDLVRIILKCIYEAITRKDRIKMIAF